MVAYSFKGRFAPPIEARTKRQTIRAVGKKRHARPGERMTMTMGDRFHPRQIGSGTCESVRPITLAFEQIRDGSRLRPFVTFGPPEDAGPGDILITPAELDAFAVLDGFANWQELSDFWLQTHGAVAEWTGLVISWGDTFVPANPPAGD